MMEILHKAKRKDTGEWVEGYYCRYQPCASKNEYINGIIPSYASALYIVETDPETVCVYTESYDKKKNRICDKDIVKNEKGDIGVIQWFPEHSAFMIWEIKNNKIHYLGDNDCSKIEIIGNEIDNPKMLGVK